MQNPAHVIHIMAHGASSPDDVGFWSDDDRTGLNLTELAERFTVDEEGIEASTVIADCCNAAQGRFVRAIRDCLEQPITYIASKRSVGWHESTTFASAFYGAYFRDRGKGMTPVVRGRIAADRSIAGFQEIVAGPCPFTVQDLTPSRRARSALGH